jgi:hypothetical protein
MISSLSFAESHRSSSVNIVTHCFHNVGMRVMSVPQNMRSGPKASPASRSVSLSGARRPVYSQNLQGG